MVHLAKTFGLADVSRLNHHHTRSVCIHTGGDEWCWSISIRTSTLHAAVECTAMLGYTPLPIHCTQCTVRSVAWRTTISSTGVYPLCGDEHDGVQFALCNIMSRGHDL